MSYSNCLETQRFNLPKKGKACIKGKSTFNLKEIIMEGDLRLTGTLNGNDPQLAFCGCLNPSQIVVTELVGFWSMWDAVAESFKFASYNYIEGHRISVPSTKIPSEGISSPSQHQFNEGKEKNTFVYFASNIDDEHFIATFNQTTNRITYLSIDDPIDDQWRCIVYDQANDRYIGIDNGVSDLYTFDPITGSKTLLSNIGSAYGFDVKDSIIINNTGYIAYNYDNTVALTRFNKNTGAWLGDINWTGTYVFSGTQFIDAIDLNILGLGLDTLNSTLHILLERYDARYLGSVKASSLSALETLISSGTFDITLSKYVLTDQLDALLYLNPQFEN